MGQIITGSIVISTALTNLLLSYKRFFYIKIEFL